ncbi:MAG: RdgB/HAM1 family non-canonical purine NTP pyrophosphatase [Gammaproteobacteria bacterium]|jgi:XTP/dITP diphosphohydrolase|nr:RdgB/HAM1 family non-canonical purine NTP pyrophosphatase [Gammaproteobacteria bacterium]MBT4494728.1 RdgB/HAM1 family non-canonical purine NTP pyrophosphatase [Gammaproteobacteria bacterium]MBT7372249.1 RdgB/HAM1 family non-canonical purine NTP pyrophosphatase [Gammaproteobacteria bacterium]
MQFVLASSNAHKADEIRTLVPDRFQLVLQSSLDVEPPDETGVTFVENALIKARYAAQITGLPAIADDSGLCVDALNGAPGVHSARYAGASSTDHENVEKLLAAMKGIDRRKARFYCVLVSVRHANDPMPLITEAAWNGEIAREPAGKAGFGYDPVFYLPDLSRTAAELTMSDKNKISHRGQALNQLVSKLIECYPA